MDDSSMWGTVLLVGWFLWIRGQKGLGTGCFCRATTGTLWFKQEQGKNCFLWLTLQPRGWSLFLVSCLGPLFLTLRRPQKGHRGSSASCGKLLCQSVPLLPGLVTSRVEKASTASPKTARADLNQDEDLPFICKQSWLYNISVCVCVCVYVYIYIFSLMEIWSQPDMTGVELGVLVYGSHVFPKSQSKCLYTGKFQIKSHRKGRDFEQIISLLEQSTRRLFLDSTSHSASCPWALQIWWALLCLAPLCAGWFQEVRPQNY